MTDLNTLWQSIAASGSIDAYIEAQLVEHGFAVKRKPTDDMSKRQKDAYKKSLKKEAAERKRLKKEAWQAYRATHIVHLGDGIHFCDADTVDAWDLDEPEARAAENELPKLDSPADLAAALGLTIPEVRRTSRQHSGSRSPRSAGWRTTVKSRRACTMCGSRFPSGPVASGPSGRRCPS